MEGLTIREARRKRCRCGRRIGEAMVKHAMAHACRRGATRLTLTSNGKRLDAHRFYERLGFEKSHAGFQIRL